MARPREFEPEEALQKAMLQFWAKGFHDTSIRDLTARTGVNQYGLYGVFENKLGLYLAALDHYRDTITQDVVKALKRKGPVARRVADALELLVERMQTPDGPVGCLIGNAAIEMAPDDPATAAKVRAHMAHLRRAFRERLSAAQAAGDLPPGKNVDALAEFLTTTAYSLGFLLRAGCDKAYLRRHIGTALLALR
ncbi:MAG: TetR/AcrR family transcriptional regulator [Pseudomonadota bacterium]